MKIGVIGAGRLGLTFALLCEKNGYDVLVSDVREDYVSNLNRKVCITTEPSVETMLLNTNNFSATTNNVDVIKNSDIIFIFVATPSTSIGNYDTTKVFDVVSDFFIANSLGVELHDKKVIIGCTTNPGDTEKVQKKLSSLKIQVAYNPEFIAQGEIVKGLEESDIVLIGTEFTELGNELIKIYNKIQITSINPYIMSPKAAELTKIGINCFLTTKISFANMIGDIMVKSNLEDEIEKVLSAIGGDTRVGKKYMKYGFGFGGPCLPRDNRALGYYAKNLGMELNIPLTVDNFNRQHANFLKEYYVSKNPDKSVPFVMNHITYKKGTDITEESQQLQLCIDLLNEGYYVNVIEDNDSISKKFKSLSKDYSNKLKFFKSVDNANGFKINL